MPQSLVRNYLHIVFSTKYRQPIIKDSIAPRLYQYMGGICRALDSSAIKIGGHYDHVHILCMMSRTISVAELVKKIKGSSSAWVKSVDDELAKFQWQNGYGAFSVGENYVFSVSEYISNQSVHHGNVDFKQEFLAILREHKMEFEEKYLWD
jgi:putative transposase